jgi:hypothetical protein
MSPQLHSSVDENHLEIHYRVHKARDYFLENKPGDRILESALMASDQYREVHMREHWIETMKEVSKNPVSKGDNKEQQGLLVVE